MSLALLVAEVVWEGGPILRAQEAPVRTQIHSPLVSGAAIPEKSSLLHFYKLRTLHRQCGESNDADLAEHVRGDVYRLNLDGVQGKCLKSSFPLPGSGAWHEAADVRMDGRSQDMVNFTEAEFRARLDKCPHASVCVVLINLLVFIASNSQYQWLPTALTQFLDARKEPVSFITLTGDKCFPFLNARVPSESLLFLLDVLNHVKVVRWYATNVCTPHAKVLALPAGPWTRVGCYESGGCFAPHDKREEYLYTRPAHLFYRSRRDRLVYVSMRETSGNAYFEQTRGVRTRAQHAMNMSGLLDGESGRSHHEVLPVYQFVASPPGRGFDCHRTWEAMLYGCIPIVERHGPYEEMYAGLPVLMTSDWNLSRPELEQAAREIRAKAYVWEKLYATYWLSRIELEAELGRIVSEQELQAVLSSGSVESIKRRRSILSPFL
ncbi:hypothetical protein FVE85_4238 [Porphyridium purpureum]|uniref:Exostosin GT47 domain-containing protein n=1 Tax=Porphyridium purpureum TaxID=35688 RepID=A0A5J4YU22_PORPP|nr:hypothetical protein FVE85_4238 [Porphyridium purpureum]|eukprot:POR5717..scf229_5